jgi:DNA-binding response OmpR family regulator
MNSTRLPYSVLVVDERPLVAARLVEPLRDAGYDVVVATTFEAAKQRLAVRPPNLLIAASRLGLFNGMHLVVCGHLDHPTMAAILTAHEKDPVLEAEASTYGAACVLTPETSAELLELVSSAFASQHM